MAGRRVIMLDRDGTIVKEKHYLSDPNDLELLPKTAAGLRHLRTMGFGLVVVTNQSPINRGFFSVAQLDLIHQRLRDLLHQEGIDLDAIYYCPHTPDEGCKCRKPAEGMILRAARDLQFDPAQSFMVGDKICDLQAGRNVGATTLLVRTGYGAELESHTPNPSEADYIVDDLQQAATIIENSGRSISAA